MSIFVRIEDKHVPIYRVLWISATPHFCGEAECTCEGMYEIALEGGESVWANPNEQQSLLERMEEWQGGDRF